MSTEKKHSEQLFNGCTINNDDVVDCASGSGSEFCLINVGFAWTERVITFQMYSIIMMLLSGVLESTFSLSVRINGLALQLKLDGPKMLRYIALIIKCWFQEKTSLLITFYRSRFVAFQNASKQRQWHGCRWFNCCYVFPFRFLLGKIMQVSTTWYFHPVIQLSFMFTW